MGFLVTCSDARQPCHAASDSPIMAANYEHSLTPFPRHCLDAFSLQPHVFQPSLVFDPSLIDLFNPIQLSRSHPNLPRTGPLAVVAKSRYLVTSHSNSDARLGRLFHLRGLPNRDRQDVLNPHTGPCPILGLGAKANRQLLGHSF